MKRQAKRRAGVVLTIAAVCWSACGCGSQRPTDHDQRSNANRVFAANAAIAYWARRLGDPWLDVWFPVPPGADPDFWRPDDPTLERIQACRLILLDRPGSAPWTDTTSLPPSRVVRTTDLFRGRLIELKQAMTHRHGPGGEHSHRGYAPCPWLDPDLALLQAESVRDALRAVYPNRRSLIDQRWRALEADLNEWRSDLESMRKETGGRVLLASHPVYEYLGRWGGWPVKSVHWEPGDEPSEEAWKALWKLREESGAKVMLWEDEPLERVRQTLESRGVRVVVFRPAAQSIQQGDWLKEMRADARRLREALQE